jgi:hypothetical protein
MVAAALLANQVGPGDGVSHLRLVVGIRAVAAGDVDVARSAEVREEASGVGCDRRRYACRLSEPPRGDSD